MSDEVAPAEADDAPQDPSVEALIEGMMSAIHSIDERLQAVESVVSTDDPDVNFADWLEWLKETYGMDDDLPEEWDSIPGIRQELEALCAMWCSAFKKDGSPVRGAGAVRWHESLVSTRDRIQRYRTEASNRSMVGDL